MEEMQPSLAPVLQAWALGSLSVPITSKKAEHALLLLRGQWAMSLFPEGLRWASGGRVGGRVT